jgi:hypothetical protein
MASVPHPTPFLPRSDKTLNCNFMIFYKYKAGLNLKPETLCNSSSRYYFHRQPFHWCTFYVTELVGCCDIRVLLTKHAVNWKKFWKYRMIEEVTP